MYMYSASFAIGKCIFNMFNLRDFSYCKLKRICIIYVLIDTYFEIIFKISNIFTVN